MPAVKPGPADAFFGKALQSVMAVLYAYPERAFSEREILVRTGLGEEAMRAQMDVLERGGHVTSRLVDKSRRYRVNRESPVFDEVRGLAIKTFALVEPLREALRPVERHVAAAWIHGLTADAERCWDDYDLVAIVRHLSREDIARCLESLDVGRAIRVTTFTPDAWTRADRRTRERYATGPRLVVIDTATGTP